MEPAVLAKIEVRVLLELPTALADMRAEAVREGFHFLDRLATEWQSGANRFDRPGEVLLGAYRTGILLGLGGLNRDPYIGQARTGRLRHLYVLHAARHHGVASVVLQQLLERAQGVFDVVRLRTATQAAAQFYQARGFVRVHDKTASHVIALPQL